MQTTDDSMDFHYATTDCFSTELYRVLKGLYTQIDVAVICDSSDLCWLFFAPCGHRHCHRAKLFKLSACYELL